MNTPIVSENYYKERAGVLKVALELNNYGYIFRETSNGDIGIDGQIEMANSTGRVIGKIVAAQIKSGDSYLTDKGDHFAFYPTVNHKNYWSLFPLPVILFVYSPNNDKIYFTDVRYQLNIPNRKQDYVILKKENYLNISNHSKIFETAGGFDGEYFEMEQIFDTMISTVCKNITFNISYLDLFCQGLTNICRHLYFSMDLATEIAEFNNESEYGLSLGYNEYEFLNSYCKFLITQNLAFIDYSDYLIDWNERELVPTFIAPLTKRGFELLDKIKEIQDRYAKELPNTTLVREHFISMSFRTDDDFERLRLGKVIREKYVRI
ncbi:DUF4365 domain-containing protein [Chryseobacterium sp. 2987]|uniref:DUF4365 domain-containing protein n=1 Tax=Chryseobacterium sp. 2987 TaxID=2817767 RepID=UPI00285D0FBF|nr:DUF4365 domain-containing protein [Chryseobacterium sp. 2987]MDR6919986.1 hypothetical protein [Chryseobacterium sp. 2987]